MAYTVVYNSQSNDESTQNTVQYLNDDAEEIDLQEIVQNCTELGISAKLYDAAGFPKGSVDDEGNYKVL